MRLIQLTPLFLLACFPFITDTDHWHNLDHFDLDSDGDFSVDDCDDHDSKIHHGAEEVAGDGVDQNCDGLELCYLDDDEDGFGAETVELELVDTGMGSEFCISPGFSHIAGDCDDHNEDFVPGRDETPGDGYDFNCDGIEVCYEDLDSDSFGSDETVTVPILANIDDEVCDAEGSASRANDCNDTDFLFHDGAEETPGDPDYNCDENVYCYIDEDDDGYGDDSKPPVRLPKTSCEQITWSGSSYTNNNLDCNDGDSDIPLDEPRDPRDTDSVPVNCRTLLSAPDARTPPPNIYEPNSESYVSTLSSEYGTRIVSYTAETGNSGFLIGAPEFEGTMGSGFIERVDIASLDTPKGNDFILHGGGQIGTAMAAYTDGIDTNFHLYAAPELDEVAYFRLPGQPVETVVQPSFITEAFGTRLLQNTTTTANYLVVSLVNDGAGSISLIDDFLGEDSVVLENTFYIGPSASSSSFGEALAQGPFLQTGINDLAIGDRLKDRVYIARTEGQSFIANEWASPDFFLVGFEGSRLGTAVEVCDLDADGLAELVISAPYYTTNGELYGTTSEGSTIILRIDATSLDFGQDDATKITLFPTIIQEIRGASPSQGVYSIACSQDYDGNGVNDLVLGSPLHSAHVNGHTADFSGSVALFLGENLPLDGTMLSLADADDWISGGFNFDHLGRDVEFNDPQSDAEPVVLAVGAPGMDTDGAVWFFTHDTDL